MLFDDRKYPYHLMLQNFVLQGGQDAFFDCFKMAFDMQKEQTAQSSSNEMPDGIMEFLDSWLLLLEKMTNPQTLFDSPYLLPNKHLPSVQFDPDQYLIRTHRVSFFVQIE